jgi:hypothetical protein
VCHALSCPVRRVPCPSLMLTFDIGVLASLREVLTSGFTGSFGSEANRRKASKMKGLDFRENEFIHFHGKAAPASKRSVAFVS